MKQTLALIAYSCLLLWSNFALSTSNSTLTTSSYPWSNDASLSVVEQHWIKHMLACCDGNKTEAARRLGIDASTLHRKLK